jgi:hypothetical protein
MATPAVAVGNSNKLTQVEKQEQEIAEACNRLIKNCIICWNYLKKKMGSGLEISVLGKMIFQDLALG